VRVVAVVFVVGCGRIGFDPLAEIPRVAVNDDSACAVVDGRVACWGANFGQLGCRRGEPSID